MKTFFSFLAIICLSASLQAQNKSTLKFDLNEEQGHYVRLTFLNQTWFRYTELNPGSLVDDVEREEVFDIGLRRTRIQLYGKISDKIFFYTQFGQNNFNFLTKRYQGIYFHDALAEYRFNKHLEFGGGLSGWSGLSRYASPSIGSILSLDAPLYQQATNGMSDQFVRKLSLYLKGELAAFDYRLALTHPMSIAGSGKMQPLSEKSEFNPYTNALQGQGYVKYQFLDKEKHETPYAAGTYLGKKKVFNIGMGAIYQPKAMWHLQGQDTIQTALLLLGLDLFYDAPVGSKGYAITLYSAYNYYDMGKGYVRNVGVMNPANGLEASSNTYGGQGNGIPMIGTGHTFYQQAGFLLPVKKVFLQPYATVQLSAFDEIDPLIVVWESGINLLFSRSHRSKLSLNLQNRPVFETINNEVQYKSRKNMIQFQFQVSI